MNIATVLFSGGEFSPKIDARSDTEKYAGGCRQSDNMIPSKFGGSKRRPGTEFISSSSAFNNIWESIIAYENVVVCWENTVVSSYSVLLSDISCWENDVVCYENEVVSEVAFIANLLCYENSMVFHENEAVYI